MVLSEGRQLILVHAGDARASDPYFAAGRFFHAGELVEQRTFSGTGGAEDTADLPAHDLQIDVSQCDNRLDVYKRQR